MGKYCNRFKVFVTKDFPRIYEEVIHFEDDNSNGDMVIIKSGYYDNEPYNEHWVSAVMLKPGEWFWTYKEARKDWDKRQNVRIESMISRYNLLEEQIEQTKKHKISRTDVEKHDYWKNLPEGKQEQIDRYKRIELKHKREEAAKDLEAQRKKLQRLEKEVKDLGI